MTLLNFSVFLLVAGVLGTQVICYSSMAQAEGCTTNYSIDHVKMVMSWGPGYCSSGKMSHGCKSGVKPEFTLHGLWPQEKDKDGPARCCTKERFDPQVLAPIKGKLNRFWPTLTNSPDQEFWSYQWSKHGSCATKLKGLNKVYDYFNFATDSMRNSDLTKVMLASQFKPSNEKLYSGRAIVKDLAQIYGVKVAIECAPARNKPHLYVLTEISTCFDTKLESIDCPYTKRRCLDQILIPSTRI